MKYYVLWIFCLPLVLVILGIPLLSKITSKLKKLGELRKKLIKSYVSELTLLEKKLEDVVNFATNGDTYLTQNTRSNLRKEFHFFDKKIMAHRSMLKTLPSELKLQLKFLNEKTKILKQKVKTYNERFMAIRKKEYNYLWKKSPFTLDDEQLTAIIKDDSYNLVVAGAGSGKTEVMINRLAYLIERKPDGIDFKKILALTFTKKAAKELEVRFKKRYGRKLDIRTFHSLGNQILKDTLKLKKPTLKFSGDNFERQYYLLISEIFEQLKQENKEFQKNLIEFLKLVRDPEIKKEADFEDKRNFYRYHKKLRYVALNGVNVKSLAEKEILNFFLTHKLNGKKIKIKYEVPVDWDEYETESGELRSFEPDFYFPEFDIYFEHWAVGEKGKLPPWFEGENATEDYLKSKQIKISKYIENEKVLVETNHSDFKADNFEKIIQDRFSATLQKKYPSQDFTIEKISFNEIIDDVWREVAMFFKTIPTQLSAFVRISKTYGLSPEKIKRRLKNERWSNKQRLFGRLAIEVFKEYEKTLKSENKIDFMDMINLSVKQLQKNKEVCANKYDAILVDEFQDISHQRGLLIKSLMKNNPNCKLFCVGDDWQSIYAFAGSELDLFVNFDKHFGKSERTDLTTNYRSVKPIVDCAADLIKLNGDKQLDKKTNSNFSEGKKLQVYISKTEKLDQSYFRQVARHCMNKILEMKKLQNCDFKDFMILTRIKNNLWLKNSILDAAKEFKIPISDFVIGTNKVNFLSVHSSKGLEAKNVFILNVIDDLYGFPCLIEDSNLMQLAIDSDNKPEDFEEERRLFYVALTRAKENLTIYTHKNYKSPFINEIEKFIEKKHIS